MQNAPEIHHFKSAKVNKVAHTKREEEDSLYLSSNRKHRRNQVVLEILLHELHLEEQWSRSMLFCNIFTRQQHLALMVLCV